MDRKLEGADRYRRTKADRPLDTEVRWGWGRGGGREANRQRQRLKQADTQTDKWGDRQTKKQTDTDRELMRAS